MSLETGTFIDDLVANNPISATDLVRYGAQHLQLIKKTIKNSFSGAVGAVMCIGDDTGHVNVIQVSPAPALPEYSPRMLLVWRQAVTNTGAVTYQATGLAVIPISSIAGVALVANDLITGHVYVACVNDAGTSAELIAVTKNYVDQLSFSAALPAQTKGILISTGVVASFSNTLPTQLNFLQAASVASSATPNIWAGDGNTLHLTGNTGPITSFGTAPNAGATRRLICDSTPTFTNNANIVIPGGANYTAAAGDIINVTADTTTKCYLEITKANGIAVSVPLTPYLNIRELQPASVNAGDSVASTITQTRNLNTIVINTITGASLSSTLITLPAGTYEVLGSAPGLRCNGHQAFLYNTTDSTYPIVGSNGLSNSGDTTNSLSLVRGQFTISSAKVFSMRHYTAAAATSGLGSQVGSGQGEVYAEIEFWKIA